MTIPLSVPVVNGNEWKYVKECLDTGWVSSAGSFVNKFEKETSSFLGVPFTVATVNGTSALHTTLIISGIGVDDEVIVPTVTFIAPINAVRYSGAYPVFMDCDDYLNIDVSKVKDFFERECVWKEGRLLNKTTGRTIKAIVPVHIFGHLVDLELLVELAIKYNLHIIEDATESLGSHYCNGRFKDKHAGTIGKFGCLSFNGNKIITTGGGGMIITSDSECAKKARYLTTQAKDDEKRFIHNEIGYNYRLTNLQAAMGVAQLEQLPRFINAKRSNFKKYCEAFDGFKGLHLIEEPSYSHSNYWHYSLVLDSKQLRISNVRLMNGLRQKGVQTRPLWYLNHLQKPYLECQSYRIEKALYYQDAVLNIPCSVNITDADIAFVAEQIKELAKIL